jgi:hypothetical protein
MSTPNPTAPSTGQQILAVLELDLLTTAGSPVLTFLQAVAKSPNTLGYAAALIQLQGNLIGALPTFEATLAQQISTSLTNKLQAAIAKAEAEAQGKPG